MTDRQLDQKLQLMARLPPSVSLDQIGRWVRRGRPHPKLHTVVWLSRVGPQ